MPGHLVHQADVKPRIDHDGVETRTTIDSTCGCRALVQSIVSFPIGRSQGSAMAGHEQSMFVLSGTATLYLDGLGHHELTPGTAAYIASGESYSIENDGPEPLVVLVVDAPTPAEGDTPTLGARKFTVDSATQPDEEAGIGRTFRVLVDPAVGCAGFTQFMGEIPIGRAPDHSHTYDEVGYIVEGEGIAHVGGKQTRITAGSCFHLPPEHVHCIENDGSGVMRIMGVFHPSGDPASRSYDEARSTSSSPATSQ
jgi:mannose-6-phosphate isomerase-like protein (cupin superfamily)